MLDVVDVVGREPTAPGIKYEAESAAGPGGQFDLAGVRIEGEIVVTQHDGQSLPERRREPTAIAAVGHVDPAVEVIAEAVGQRIADAEPQPAEDNRAPVGASVAIGVLEEDDLRRGQHEDAVAPRQHAGGVAEIRGEDCRAVRQAVAVGISQPAHGAARSPGGTRAIGIIPAFGDIGHAIGSEGQAHWIHHLRLGAPDLGSEPGIEVEPTGHRRHRRRFRTDHPGETQRPERHRRSPAQLHVRRIRLRGTPSTCELP